MKRRIILAGGIVGLMAVAVVGVIVVQLLRSDDPNLATEAPVIAAQEPEVSPLAASPAQDDRGANGDVATLPDGVRRFVIIPAESEVKYVVRESLRGLQTNAVGTTSAIEGAIHLTEDGLAGGELSSFQVDLSTLQSDEGMRDNYIKRNTLQTAQYRFAEFVIDAITGFPEGYVENSQVELTLTGTLTIREISRPVTWTVLARQAGNTLTATADTDIRFDEFGMDPPSVPIATAQDEIHIQVVVVAREG